MRRRSVLFWGLASLLAPGVAALTGNSYVRAVSQNGRTGQDERTWIVFNGERRLIAEHDKRGVWFLPHDDSEYEVLVPFYQRVRDQERGLVCNGSVYSVIVGRTSVA